MSLISTEFARVATLLNLEYQRSITLSEANIYRHYNKYNLPILLYNGISVINTVYTNNPSGIDNYTVEFYVLVLKTTTDDLATDIDTQLESVRKLVGSILDEFKVVEDIDAFSSEGLQLADDMLIGYRVTAVLPLYHVC